MSATEKIEKKCKDSLCLMGLGEDCRYVERLNQELGDLTLWKKHKGIDKAEEIVCKIESGMCPVSHNKSNSLILFLTGLSSFDPIANRKERVFEILVSGDVPDIDTDFDPRIRDWVKKHIVEVFGASNVCSIGTYQTFKTRAVILDVARVLGENLAEVSAVTKRIEPFKAFEDETGEEQKVDNMEFDDICEHYPELKEYFNAHPEVRQHAEVLRNQVKNMGTHAGGVIISDLDLRDRIPVLYDKPSSENRQVISAWAESGSVQELSSVGLVKYDILGLNNLPVISDCIKLIEHTKGVHINRCDIPISDRESILLGSKKDMVGIFQFENPVTKPIANAVGMESLDDVAAITSLIRPGPMDAEINGVRMPLEYARRKHGGEYESPEFIRKALSSTYSLIVYQEQTMKIARILSGFTAGEANKLRKAIGKKQVDLMASMKEKFIKGAQIRIDAGEISKQEVLDIFDNIEKFAGYGFNRSIDISTPIWCNGDIVEVGKVKSGDIVLSEEDGQVFEAEVVTNHDHGILPAFEVEFEGGRKCVCSILHKFETKNGKVPLWQLMFGGEALYAEEPEKLGMRCKTSCHSGSISSGKLLSARFLGFRRMCDLEIHHRSHNYVLENGLVSSNSHAVAYGSITTVELWLKYNYPIEFITALVNNTKPGKKKLGSSNILADYINYARRREINVFGPDINKSGEEFRVENNGIRFSLGHVRNVSSAAKLIESFQPFTSLSDFYDRVKIETEDEDESEVVSVSEGQEDAEEEIEKPIPKKVTARRPNRKVMESLIAAGAFDCFGTRNEMAMAYWRLRAKPSKKDKLLAKITEAETKANDAAVSLVQIQASGIEKEIKKANKALAKAQERVIKAKAAVEEEEKFIQIASELNPQTKKEKDSNPPEDKTEEQWQAEETEMLGLCLSRPVLYKKYEEMIRKEGWYLVNEIDPDKKKVLVFGEIMEINQHISKAGNSMHIVYLNDGIESIKFFVFQGGWEFFKDHYRQGTIGAIPLARFEDGDGSTRFFDDRGKGVVLKK